ncbi:ribonuclease III domain-containing protein, partial [Tirmania nivea]
RLGNALSLSGKRSLCSSFALKLHTTMARPAIVAPMMAVLDLQLLGREYQPPVGDQTCLGYLLRIRCPTTAGAACSRLRPSPCGTLGVGPRAAAAVRLSTSAPSRRTYATPAHGKGSSSEQLSLPPSRSPHTSAKLSSLHARLSLSPAFPLETLARCLIDPTAEPNPKFNNSTLSNLGNNLLGYYITEHLLAKYPRLPLDVLRAAMHAYISPPALFQIGREWGVEDAFEPTLEVDAGLLQFKRLKPGEPWGPEKFFKTGDKSALEPPAPTTTNKNQNGDPKSASESAAEQEVEGIPQSHATANFVKSVFAGVYLHESPSSAHHFFRQHITSRRLDVSRLFNFEQPTRHLSRLCAREGFEPPVARLLSETGRRSKTPVFIVGAYSGEERLGEGYGASLDEARMKAAVSALKGWYLYSPVVAGGVDRPSRMEEEGAWEGGRAFTSVFVDVGEVIV